MSCLSSIVVAEKKAELAKYEARLAKYETAIDSIVSGEIESYRFDSGDGSQQVKMLNMSDLEKQISYLQSRINRLRSELRGTAVMTVNLRRRGA